MWTKGSILIAVIVAAAAIVWSQSQFGGGGIGPKLTIPGGNCTSTASPSVCGGFAMGFVAVPAGSTTLTINTTAVTANSLIIVQPDQSLGTTLSVTCNTTLNNIDVSARVAGTSFSVQTNTPVTNPECLTYHIIN